MMAFRKVDSITSNRLPDAGHVEIARLLSVSADTLWLGWFVFMEASELFERMV
jgi:hypothetical protein